MAGGLCGRVLQLAIPPVSATAARRTGLADRVSHFFEESEGTYGYRRIAADLAAENTECSPELVRQIMRQEGLVPCQPRPLRTTTEADAEAAASMPDLVKRDFTANRPALRLMVILRIFTRGRGSSIWRRMINYYRRKSLAGRSRITCVAELVRRPCATPADTSRIKQRDQPQPAPRKCLYLGFIPGFGCPLGMRSSMGKTGICWDNSAGRNFFLALKNERVYRTTYATEERARKDVIRYIEGFYNSRRRHSALGYRRPNEVHYSYQQSATAA